jgi:hypothetical protein
VFAKLETAFAEADICWVHDLVGLSVLEYAILMDAKLMRECIGADNGLVELNGYACKLGYLFQMFNSVQYNYMSFTWPF